MTDKEETMVGSQETDFACGCDCCTDAECDECGYVEGTEWAIRAAAWELAALGLRYPTKELAEIAASGEWVDAAEEVAIVLDMPLPEDFGESALEFVDEVAAAGVEGSESEAVVEYVFEMPSDEELDAFMHKLRAEATRLMIGAPKPAVSPFEGVQRAEAEGVQPLLFVNPHSMAVERFVKSCGLGRPEGTNEPLDHVATECEFLQHLALRADEDALLAEALETGDEEQAAAIAQLREADTPELPESANLPGGSAEAAYGQFEREHAFVWMPGFAEALKEESRMPFFKDVAAFLGALLAFEQSYQEEGADEAGE